MTDASLPQQAQAPEPSEYVDRRTLLVLFGLIQLLLAAVCFLFVAVFVFGQRFVKSPGGGNASLQMLGPAIAMYVAMGVGWIWLGIGSILCRRWARAIVLVISWPWMCMGFVTVPWMGWVMSHMSFNGVPNGQGPAPGIMLVAILVQLVVMTLMMILLPGCMAFVYGSRNVKATCDARDPHRRWTDACPLPVLGVTCFLAVGAVAMLAMPVTGMAAFPFFGVLLVKTSGVLAMVSVSVFLMWLARTWYQIRKVGWTVLLVFVILMFVSSGVTFSQISLAEYYEQMGMPQEQINLIVSQGWMTNSFMIWSSLAWAIPIVVYLIWVKRYFRSSEATSRTDPPSALV